MVRKQKLEILQTVFFVMIVSSALPQGKAVDEAHARASAIFRAVLFMVGVLGILAVSIVKLNIDKDPKNDPSAYVPKAGERAITITYSSTLEDTQRCLRLTWRKSSAPWTTIGCLGLLTAGFMNAFMSHGDQRLAVTLFPILFIACTAGWAGLARAASISQLKTRFPTPSSVRTCTSSLTSQGFVDVTPTKTTFYSWKNIKRFAKYDGDVFVWGAMGATCFIPASAFADKAAADRFVAVAEALWRSNGTAWPEGDHITPPPPVELPPGVLQG